MKKFDKGYIYYRLISSIFSAFVVLVLFGDMVDDEVPVANGARWIILAVMYVVIYLAYVIYAVLYVQFSGYELTDTELRCRKGVLSRKTSVLSYQKVHAVNKKQNLIHRIFKIAVLTVDSGATGNAFGAEITIIERAEKADRLMALIKARQEGLSGEEWLAVGDSAEDIPSDGVSGERSFAEGSAVPKRENLYTFSSKLKLIYSALTLGTSALVMLVLAVIAVMIMGIAAVILRSSPEFSASELWLGGLLLGGLLFVLISIFSLICGMATSFFSYHDFRVHKSRRDIEISYGLFVRHTNNFKLGRIKAVKIMDGPVKRLFGYVTVGLEVVGYGSESSSDDAEQNQSAAPGTLLPLCRADKLNETLERILPGYVPDMIEHRARSYWAFVLWPALWVAVGYGSAYLAVLVVMLLLGAAPWICTVMFGIFAAAAGINLLGVLILGAFQYRNAGLTVGKKRLTIQNGTFIRRRTVIRRKDLIGIERVSTPMQAKRGICTYQIHFFTNAMTNTVVVKHLDAALGALLEALLKD